LRLREEFTINPRHPLQLPQSPWPQPARQPPAPGAPAGLGAWRAGTAQLRVAPAAHDGATRKGRRSRRSVQSRVPNWPDRSLTRQCPRWRLPPWPPHPASRGYWPDA